jgi:hypothetical protein
VENHLEPQGTVWNVGNSLERREQYCARMGAHGKTHNCDQPILFGPPNGTSEFLANMSHEIRYVVASTVGCESIYSIREVGYWKSNDEKRKEAELLDASEGSEVTDGIIIQGEDEDKEGSTSKGTPGGIHDDHSDKSEDDEDNGRLRSRH